MLSFHPPALRRDAPPDKAQSLTFDFVVLVLAAVLITASLWFVAGNGSTNDNVPCELAHMQRTQDATPQASVHSARAW